MLTRDIIQQIETGSETKSFTVTSNFTSEDGKDMVWVDHGGTRFECVCKGPCWNGETHLFYQINQVIIFIKLYKIAVEERQPDVLDLKAVL